MCEDLSLIHHWCAHAHTHTPAHTLLGLTEGNWLCINTDSDLDSWWEKEARWMERRRGGTEKERAREEWYGERGWGDFCGWGNKKGNWELESLIFNTRITEWIKYNCRSHWKSNTQQWVYLLIFGKGSLMAALFQFDSSDQYSNWMTNICRKREGIWFHWSLAIPF